LRSHVRIKSLHDLSKQNFFDKSFPCLPKIRIEILGETAILVGFKVGSRLNLFKMVSKPRDSFIDLLGNPRLISVIRRGVPCMIGAGVQGW
jgi:hypothetical protein